jgi:DNA-binding HxlR family transcriptional regulator
VRGSITGRPVMAAMDLLGRRWALRILWELRGGPVGARNILEQCAGLSSSVLYERLRDLGDAGLIAKREDGYALTAVGERLEVALAPLDGWAQSWARTSAAKRAGR